MSVAAATPPPFPEKVGKYELLLPIGTGGMATVYLARTTGAGGFERRVALKLVHAHLRADEESKLHLLEEAKLAALIRHPNVIQVQEVDEDPFGVFLVMDYVEGETLSAVVRLAKATKKHFSRRLMARVINDALLGLHAAHELQSGDGKPLNLVHRDFSPQNILISTEGHTRLGDFGVAKAADRAVRTKTGLTKGKIAYMSPEQARGRAVDRRCDVWAAGVVAWELLSGKRMHQADDDVATLLSIVTERPPRLSSVLKDIPEAVDDALAWALEPELDARCPDANSLRKALEEAFNAEDGVADISELAVFVRDVTRTELMERQERIAEVQSLRERMGELTRSRQLSSATPQSMPSSPPTAPSSPPAAAPQIVTEKVLATDAPTSRSLGSAPTTLATEAIPPIPQNPVPGDLAAAADDGTDSLPTRVVQAHRTEEHTETSAVVPTWVQPKSRSKTAIVAVALGVAGLGAAWVLSRTEEPPLVETTPMSDESASAAATSRQHNPTGTDSAPPGPASTTDKEITEVDSLPLAPPEESESRAASQEANPRSSRPRSPRSTPRPAQTEKRVGPEKPKLATSPYGESKSE